jgi:hypothetical protein
MKTTVNNVRIAFPDIFEPNKDGKFAAGFILPTDHKGLAAVEAVCEEVGKAKWGAKWPQMKKQLAAADMGLIHNGDAKATYEGYEGNLFFNASNKVRPTVVNRDRSPLTAQDGVVYSGCFVNVIIDVWAQDNEYGKRINAQLQGVQFFKDGDAFSGGGTAADAGDFDEIADGADADDLV